MNTSDVVNMIYVYLRDMNFQDTANTFQKEAQSYLKGDANQHPKHDINVVLREYEEMKTERNRREEYIKNFGGSTQKTDMLNSIISGMYNLVEVFNKSTRIPIQHNESSQSPLNSLDSFPVVVPQPKIVAPQLRKPPPSIEKPKRKRNQSGPISTVQNKIAPKTEKGSVKTPPITNMIIARQPVKLLDENSQGSLPPDYLTQLGLDQSMDFGDVQQILELPTSKKQKVETDQATTFPSTNRDVKKTSLPSMNDIGKILDKVHH